MNKINTIKIKKEIFINANAKEIFPLVCPVREYDWIKGWKCKIRYCPNGVNEEGVIFDENMSSPFLLGKAWSKTTWTTLNFDHKNNYIKFRWDNTISTSIYEITFLPVSSSQTRCVLVLNMDFFNREKITNNLDYKIGFMIDGLGNMLKYYCENNKIYNPKGSEKKKDFIKNLSFTEKLAFIGNLLSMKVMFDRDRINYLKNGKISNNTLRRSQLKKRI